MHQPHPVRESVTSTVTGKKEEVNFSMFDSIQQSQINDAESVTEKKQETVNEFFNQVPVSGVRQSSKGPQ